MDIQGSVGQSREVRQRIYERALAAAQRRIENNRAKADGIQTGKYRTPGYDPSPSPAGDSDLSTLSDEQLLQQLNQ